MSHGVRVRRADVRDLPRIVELRLALLDEHSDNPLYGRLRPDAEARAFDLYASQLASHHEAMFVAEYAGVVIGILRCVDTPGSPLLHPERYCYVSSVYVEPAHRRRGVLRILLRGAMEWCLERGLDEMRLHNPAASPIAGPVWQALGFDVVEQVRRRKLTVTSSTPRPTPPPLVTVEAR